MNRVLLILAIASAPAIARPLSPLRSEGTDYRQILGRRPFTSTGGNDAGSRGVSRQDIDLDKIPEVTPEVLATAFEFARDTSFLVDGTRPATRRVTWLYPDDGCYARAHLTSQMASGAVGVRPPKLFVYGNLLIQTPNHPLGRVGWWYHVAPVVKIATQIYVLDPAINQTGPLKLEDWDAAMGAERKIFAICEPFAYNPDSSCDAQDNPSVDTLAVVDEGRMLQPERTRLQQLGRDADAELGDRPPWRKVP